MKKDIPHTEKQIELLLSAYTRCYKHEGVSCRTCRESFIDGAIKILKYYGVVR